MKEGNYDDACTCGGCATNLFCCKHLAGCLSRGTLDWREFVKKHQTPEAWELQTGNAWEPISNDELNGIILECEASGEMLQMVQPDLRIRTSGAPRGNREEVSRRAKDFLEDGYDDDVMGEGASGKNPGGARTQKTCRLCRLAGWPGQPHRANKCPWKDGRPREEEPPSRTTPKSARESSLALKKCELCAAAGAPTVIAKPTWKCTKSSCEHNTRLHPNQTHLYVLVNTDTSARLA